MEEKLKSRDVFYGIVAISTLIVAIIGATLAYFSITANSDVGAVNATAAKVSISYIDGQQVTFQADELIPSSFDVVKIGYARAKSNSNYKSNPTADDDVTNKCIDDNNQEVCGIYRFTVSSNANKDIIAKLYNEKNTFTYLNYAVYDVTNNTWISQGDNDYKAISYCNNENKDTEDELITSDDCYSIDEYDVKTYYNDIASPAGRTAANTLFGPSSGLKYATKTLTANVSQTYDVILFIKENDANQNVDQGANFKGTIMVDVTDENAGRITGQASQN